MKPRKRSNDPFSATLYELAASFRKRQIATSSPTFCDSANFLTAERANPELLNHFSAFVAKRTYAQDYIFRAAAVIELVSSLLFEELVQNGRLAACVDISGILLRILQQEGVWSCGIKGSVTIDYPADSQIEKRYFWSIDHGDFVAGHAWVYAPPFTIVDLTISQQPYSREERIFLPKTILSQEIASDKFEVDDVVSPSARAELRHDGVPEDQHLIAIPSCLPGIHKTFPVVSIPGLRGAWLKYIPVAIHAPDGTFQSMANMMFDNLTPWEMYRSKIEPALRLKGL